MEHKWCKNVQLILNLATRLNQLLAQHPNFKELKPRFSLIGSLIERTRIGAADESDINLVFDGLDKDCFLPLENNAFDLKFSEKGKTIFISSGLGELVLSDSTLDYVGFLEKFAEAIMYCLKILKTERLFQCLEINTNFKPCKDCFQPDENDPESKLMHCKNCHPALTLTKKGACIIFKNKGIVNTVDICPIFNVPAGLIAKNTLDVMKLINQAHIKNPQPESRKI